MDAEYFNSLLLSLYNTYILFSPSVNIPFLFISQQYVKNCLLVMPKYMPKKILSTRLPLLNSFFCNASYFASPSSCLQFVNIIIIKSQMNIFMLLTINIELCVFYHYFLQSKQFSFSEFSIQLYLSLHLLKKIPTDFDALQQNFLYHLLQVMFHSLHHKCLLPVLIRKNFHPSVYLYFRLYQNHQQRFHT